MLLLGLGKSEFVIWAWFHGEQNLSPDFSAAKTNVAEVVQSEEIENPWPDNQDSCPSLVHHSISWLLQKENQEDCSNVLTGNGIPIDSGLSPESREDGAPGVGFSAPDAMLRLLYMIHLQ